MSIGTLARFQLFDVDEGEVRDWYEAFPIHLTDSLDTIKTALLTLINTEHPPPPPASPPLPPSVRTPEKSSQQQWNLTVFIVWDVDGAETELVVEGEEKKQGLTCLLQAMAARAWRPYFRVEYHLVEQFETQV